MMEEFFRKRAHDHDAEHQRRRGRLLQGASALALAGAMPADDKQIVVSDPGDPYRIAYRQAF